MHRLLHRAMEILDLLEKNSERGNKRLSPVNLYLDMTDLDLLIGLYPKLNLSKFVRDVISTALKDHETQGYVELLVKPSESEENGTT